MLKTLVASRVVVLPDLLGDANSSPFHDIVTNCDATVFESKLLQLIVQHKWEENVSSQRMRSVALYGIAFVTGAVAMTSGAKGASSTADVLQSLVLIVEMASLGVEAFGLVSVHIEPFHCCHPCCSSTANLVVWLAMHSRECPECAGARRVWQILHRALEHTRYCVE